MQCLMCKGRAFEDARHMLEQRVAGLCFLVELRARKCKQCGERHMDCETITGIDLRIAVELARRGVRTGPAFRFIRKALELRAVDVAELLDVTADTISRWERGAAVIDHAAFAVLGALACERREGRTEMLERLRAVRDPQVSTKPIRVVAA